MYVDSFIIPPFIRISNSLMFASYTLGRTIEKDIKHMFILSIIIIAMHINVIIPVYIIAF